MNFKIAGLMVLFVVAMGGVTWGNGWLDERYNNTFNISIPADMVNENLTSFPLLVSLINDNLSKAQEDGSDIIFKDASNNTLDREIEFFNQTNGQLIAWVNTSLNSLGTDIYVYFNSTETNANSKATWNDTFIMVQHLNGTSNLTQFDSTRFGNNVTRSDSDTLITYVQPGQIWKSIFFNGTGTRLNVSHNTGLNLGGAGAVFTASIWAKTVTTNVKIALSKSSADATGWKISTGPAYFGAKVVDAGVDSAGITNINLWKYVVATYDNATLRIYVDGVYSASVGGANKNPDTTNDLAIGNNMWEATPNMLGYLEHATLERANRTASWILASYLNQNNTATFYTISDTATLETTTTTTTTTTLEPTTTTLEPTTTTTVPGTTTTTLAPSEGTTNNSYLWIILLIIGLFLAIVMIR